MTRLIDADALKKAIEKEFYNADLSDYEACECVCVIYDKIIDNSPTVDTGDAKYLEERDADAWESGYIQGLSERPKGEWIMIKNSDGNLKCYECSNCGKNQGYISNYCEDCGADMRTKENLNG